MLHMIIDDHSASFPAYTKNKMALYMFAGLFSFSLGSLKVEAISFKRK